MSDDTERSGLPRAIGGYTYELVTPPEQAWTWKDYERVLLREWDQLLASDPAEALMHAFFERHPCMLPGAFEIAGGESGHSPWFAAAISKPPLPSYGARIPDFMWLANHSLGDVPILIEIEAPGKRWFTKRGQPTSDFTQALDQIREWKAWFASGHNAEEFRDFYELPHRGWILERSFTPQFVLIYGRRAEATARPAIARKRAHMQGPAEYVMTYDRLSPNPKCDDVMCVRRGVDGFTAISVPPTFTLGPVWAQVRSRIHGKAAAIERNPHLSERRKRFLLDRLPYWDTWGSQEHPGTINLGDYE